MKKAVTFLLIMSLVLCLFSACAPSRAITAETRLFTDSAGREVIIPSQIDAIAPSGSYAQIILMTLCPENLVGLSGPFTKIQKEYIDETYWNLPILGRLYGSSGTINLEELIKSAPDIIIDMGEAKAGIAADLDAVQEQTGIPIIFIEATLETMAEAYETLGEILGMEEEITEMSQYIKAVLSFAEETRSNIPESSRPRVLFSQGEYGNEVNGTGSVHAEILDVVGVINAADLDGTISSGGDEVSMEQIMLWNPEIIILAPDSNYKEIWSDPSWAAIAALKSGEVYEVPIGPYNWLNRPPSVQRVLGILWLGNLIYPEYYDFDMIEKTQEFYSIFFDYDISEDEVRELLKNSTFR